MKRSLCLLTIFLMPLSSKAIDNPHFWRATNFLPQFYEPRIAKSWLTSFDIFGGGGKTSTSRNDEGQTVPLLQLFGPERINTLAIGLPNLNFNNPVDVVLQNLSLLNCPCNFGQLGYTGHFRIGEVNFCFTQNLTCGFFIQVHFPYRDMQIRDISVCDLSQTCNTNLDQSSIYWQSFLNLYPQFLTRFNLIINDPNSGVCGTRTKGIGDTTTLLGWSYNYEETEAVDYLDFTLRVGVLAPTGKKRNPFIIFSLPNGYNGHIGVPVSASCAVGYFEWLTIGAHFGGMMFVRKNDCELVHTSPLQNGWIKLLQENVTNHEGTIWEIAAYLKADHFARGASFLAGYNFATQGRTELKSCDDTFITNQIINSDSTLSGWKMHTVNLYFEYDFSYEDRAIGPRLGIFYNIQVSGRNIFKTNMAGAFFGFDLAWCF